MAVYMICFLLSAHPDTWLSDAEFDKKYFTAESESLHALRRHLAYQYELIAKEKEERFIRDSIKFAEMTAKELELRERELQLRRTEKRIQLLLRLPSTRDRP